MSEEVPGKKKLEEEGRGMGFTCDSNLCGQNGQKSRWTDVSQEKSIDTTMHPFYLLHM